MIKHEFREGSKAFHLLLQSYPFLKLLNDYVYMPKKSDAKQAFFIVFIGLLDSIEFKCIKLRGKQ